MLYQSQILLQTKLHRPHLPRDLVARTRLVEMLDQGIEHPLVLVCAPAGFGKTTLIGSWLDGVASGQGEKAASMPSAWLSLDENDSDLILFLRYFIAALRTIFNEACAETLVLLHAVRQPPVCTGRDCSYAVDPSADRKTHGRTKRGNSKRGKSLN